MPQSFRFKASPAVLRPGVPSLSIECGGVVLVPEYPEELLVGDLIRVVYDLCVCARNPTVGFERGPSW